MPAFASFLRQYVPELSFIKSLKSKLLRDSSKGISGFDSNQPLPQKFRNTDSSSPSKEGPYYELSEPGYMEPQITSTQTLTDKANAGHSGIYRSVEFTQTQDSHYSSDRLV